MGMFSFEQGRKEYNPEDSHGEDVSNNLYSIRKPTSILNILLLTV